MKRIFLLLLTCSLFAGSATAGPTVRELVTQLMKDGDSRVRMRAALDLGKSRNRRVRPSLERALKDKSPSVRAAAAAALRVLGDPEAVAALDRHSRDSDSGVRGQVEAALASLRKRAEHDRKGAKYWVKVGTITSERESDEQLLRYLKVEARRKLEALSGVYVVAEGEELPGEEGPSKTPVVFVTAHLRSAAEAQQESSTVYSARVEFVVHSYPSRAIAGLIAGNASMRVAQSETQDRKQVLRLRREVIVAAIDSALRRAPEAFEAAAQF